VVVLRGARLAVFKSWTVTAVWIPVSSEISDFMPCAHTQSNILQIKFAEKTDDLGLEFSVEVSVYRVRVRKRNIIEV